MKLYTEDAVKVALEGRDDAEDIIAKLAEGKQVCDLEPLPVDEGQALIFMFPVEYGSMIAEIAPVIQKIYPDNPVIAVVNDIDILVENADDALDLLDNMKAKISILKDTGSTNKIIV